MYLPKFIVQFYIVLTFSWLWVWYDQSIWTGTRKKAYPVIVASAIFIIFCGRFPLQLAAQSPNYRFEHVTIEDGISDLGVDAILQDHQGFMWFGTGDGLNRYNGYEYQVYRHDPADPTSIGGNSILELYEDSQGRIWIGLLSDTAGLCRYDPETDSFIRYVYNPKDSTGTGFRAVQSIAETRDGYLWLGSWWGLARLDTQTGAIKYFQHDPNDPTSLAPHPGILSIHEDSRGQLWIASGFMNDPFTGGLSLYHPDTESFSRYQHDPNDPSSLHRNAVLSVFEDSRENLWVGTMGDGLHLMDRTKGTFQHFPYNPNEEQQLSAPHSQFNGVTFIYEDPLNRLWIGGGGLVLFDPETQQLVRFKPEADNPASFSAIWVRHMGADRSGNLWFGDEASIFLDKTKLSPSIFREYVENITDEKSLRGSNVKSLTPDGKRDLWWIGTEKGMNLYDLARGELQFFKPTEGVVNAICKDGPFTLWYGGWGTGLFKYDIRTDQTQHFPNLAGDPDRLNHITIRCLMSSKSGTLWVGTWGEGVYRYDRDNNTFSRYPKEGFFLPEYILEDQTGALWVGAASGLFRYDIQQDRLEKTLDVPIKSLLESRNGQFWIGTDGAGLWRYDRISGAVEIFAEKDGLASNVVSQIAEDASGNLWLGTNRKISKFQVDSLLFTNFDARDGVYTAIGATGSADAVAYSKNGDIYFGGVTGMIRISPQEIPQILEPPQISLTRLQTPGDNFRLLYQSRATITLPYDQNELVFEYVGLHYTNPAKNQYQYILENSDDDWVAAGTDRKARYTNLDPGTYTFRVKAISSEGLLSEEEASIRVVIRPPWWQTWWAYTLYGLMILALLWGIYVYQRRRWQLRAQLEVEQEKALRLTELDNFKSRFYTNITHEFRTPLTVIKGMADQISGNEKIRQLIRRNSNRLLAMVNQLLDLSKLENNSLQIKWVQADIIPYLQYLTESCHSLAESKKLNLAFFSRENELLMDFDEEKLQQILINLLSNAVKFTPEYGSVKVIAGRVEESGDESPSAFSLFVPQAQSNANPRGRTQTGNEEGRLGPRSTFLRTGSYELLELEVKDTGRGIPPEKLEHIFDRFYQVDDSATRQGEGSGIGLALVKELVQLLEGRIEVESEVGKGSSFKVYLPIHQRAEQPVFTAEDRAEPILAAAPVSFAEESKLIADLKSEKPLVLIIEDNADVVEYIVSCLAADYQLQTAPNGRLGVEKALEIIPDVILCDVMMPEMDGFEVCRQLKAASPTSHIPIVLLTAKATQEDKVTGLSQGADAYLTKPFDKAELLVRLDNLSRLSQQLRERLSTPATEALPDPLSNKEAAFLQELSQLVADNLGDEDFNTPRLCRAIAMSRTQLHRKLKALTGQSTAQYIRHCRMQKARSLLEQTDLPIGEIAGQVGFKDFSHFSKTFLKVLGKSPSDFRQL